LLGKFNGVTYIDDAYSTNIDPTIAAIDAIQTPLVLITGGFDKQLDFTELGKKISSAPNLKALVVIGQVTDKILAAAAGYKGKILKGATSMAEILAQANSVAVAGDTVLFSPATSSFDLFKNETDRGEQFVKAVNVL
jgi:UDP-N-acetylmuramoylalanine--D-glutamate ligase